MTKKCIICEMIKIFFSGLWEVIQIIFAMAIVFSLPFAALFGIDWLLLKYLGEPTRNIVVLVACVIGLLVFLVAAFRDLYKKAQARCERPNNV